jgi:hypothetical protein
VRAAKRPRPTASFVQPGAAGSSGAENSEALWAATTLHTVLARIAPADPALQSALAPAVELFLAGRRKTPPSDPAAKK